MQSLKGKVGIMKYRKLLATFLAAIGLIAGYQTANDATIKIVAAESEQVTKASKPKRLKIAPNKTQAAFIKPWSYQEERKLSLLDLDNLGRAQGSHIQVKRSELPTEPRAPRLTVNPSGWHNYKIETTKNGKPYTAWAFNRGHLVGYQFSGLNDEKRNLITETAYLNQGSTTGMDDTNSKAMLYYENLLRKWINEHPRSKLDYAVIPLYYQDELVARKVLLSFVGVTPANRQTKIKLPISGLKMKGKVTQVILDNDSPMLDIDYLTGAATVLNSEKYLRREAVRQESLRRVEESNDTNFEN